MREVRRLSRAERRAFRLRYYILDNGTRYADCRDDWQERNNEALRTRKRVYLELPRGHSKTSDLAFFALECLHCERDGVTYAAACDREQAGLIEDAIKGAIRRCPTVGRGVTIKAHTVRHARNNSRAVILPCDGPGNWGLRYDRLIIEELSNWTLPRHRENWEALISAAAKQACQVVVASNAGRECSGWLWEFREHCRKSDDWYFYRSEGPVASWLTDKAIEEQRKILPPGAFRRVIMNEWGARDDALFTREQIEAVTIGAGPARERPPDAERVVCAIDLGLRHDFTAIAAVAKIRGGGYRLLALEVLTGTREHPVQIDKAVSLLESVAKRFKAEKVVGDPWQMEGTLQRKSWLEPFTFTAKSVGELSQALYEGVVSRDLEIYADAGRTDRGGEIWNLERELATVVEVSTSYGWRIDHKASGFTDRCMAVGMCLVALRKQRPVPQVFVPGIDEADDGAWQSRRSLADIVEHVGASRW